MPIYEYECQGCSKIHEIIHKFNDPPFEKCPDCDGELKKIISSTSFVLKGEGWYVTDYPSKDRKNATESEKKSTSPSEKKETSSGKEEKKKETAAVE